MTRTHASRREQGTGEDALRKGEQGCARRGGHLPAGKRVPSTRVEVMFCTHISEAVLRQGREVQLSDAGADRG